MEIEQRLLNKVDWQAVVDLNSCWNWIGATTSNGYGQIHFINRNVAAHRVSYWLYRELKRTNRVQVCNPSVHVCHKCDNRRCINPMHLFLGTRIDNMQDAKSKGRLFILPGKGLTGSKHFNSKLTEEQIVEIRTLLSQLIAVAEIAHKFKVDKSLIYKIKSGKKYSTCGLTEFQKGEVRG
jgi:hypothetical protein